MAKWIVKADDTVISHCRCAGTLAGAPGQLDCPWCGCGWLFSCIDCRKAFTFGEVVETDLSYVQLACRDVLGRPGHADDAHAAEVAEWMRLAVEDLTAGDRVVYLDGAFLKIQSTNIDHVGWYAEHKLANLPHIEDAGNGHHLNATLGSVEYWTDRELPDRDE